MDKKLTIELVPQSSWYSNVRSNVSRAEWDVIRKASYAKADYRCEVCREKGTSQGFKHPVECHEVWDYDDRACTRTLKGLISLCPLCHKTKHVGLAQINNEEHLVIKQLIKVNGMTKQEANQYISDSFKIWKERSAKNWKLDISLLDSLK